MAFSVDIQIRHRIPQHLAGALEEDLTVDAAEQIGIIGKLIYPRISLLETVGDFHGEFPIFESVGAGEERIEDVVAHIPLVEEAIGELK